MLITRASGFGLTTTQYESFLTTALQPGPDIEEVAICVGNQSNGLC